MKKKVEKWQEPAPAKQHKVLPVPDLEPKKRRGGRRFRKMKERYGLTDMRKAANRYDSSVVAVAIQYFVLIKTALVTKKIVLVPNCPHSEVQLQ